MIMRKMINNMQNLLASHSVLDATVNYIYIYIYIYVMNTHEEKQKQSKTLSQIKRTPRNSQMLCFWKMSIGSHSGSFEIIFFFN